MRKPALPVIVLSALLCLSLEAVVPQKFELRTMDDFLRGKFNGISVSSDGKLALAPNEVRTEAPGEEFYLSFLALGDGTAFLGTGHGGKIYRIDKDGKAELYFQAPEMDVTCLARDRKGALYAGTSPNGKIYKIPEANKGEEFFNPGEKYIWELLFRDGDRLWAAVGETGGIYEINALGEGRVIFKAEENHLLCLKETGRGDVLAGSGGGGLVYRISPEGRAAVLFATPYEEVKSLALDDAGMIYAAASGTPSQRADKDEPVSLSPRADAAVTVTVSASVPAVPSSPSPAGKARGALYRINAEGLASRLWSSEEEMAYTVIWKRDGRRVIFGTGNRGRIYAVDGDGQVSLLLQQNSEQVYHLAASASDIHVLSNNPCYLGKVQTEKRFTGDYISPVLDARILSSWGRLGWQAETTSGAGLELQTRSGNTNEPNSTWSPWSPLYQKGDEQILSPKARFIQVRVQFRTQTGKDSPLLSGVTLFYLQNNVPPSVSRLEFLEPNEVYLKLPEQEDVILGAEKIVAERPAEKDPLRIGVPGRKAERKGFRTVTWDAADDNGDTLGYAVSIRREDEKDWRTIQDGLSEDLFAFDTRSFPDGTYFLKVTASDLPSNPPGTELTHEKLSRPLVIDNSLPVVRNLAAALSGDTLELAFTAEDGYSSIEEVKFLIRPDGWRVLFPVDGIADSRRETFKASVRIPAGAARLVTVRVRDSFGNVGVYQKEF
jgi:sugar lactone lactonase YvrE